MMSDPLDQNNFILLETNEEADMALKAGLIDLANIKYVEREVVRCFPCLGYTNAPKRFIQAPRDLDKIELMLDFLNRKGGS